MGIEDLKNKAAGLIARNAVALSKPALEGDMTPPAQQWWNLPAKYAAAERIAGEEGRASWSSGLRPHNNLPDATRHARTMQRLTNEAGPMFASVAGAAHEGWDLVEALAKDGRAGLRYWVPEAKMDMHNNAVGLQAGLTGRPINPRLLQVKP